MVCSVLVVPWVERQTQDQDVLFTNYFHPCVCQQFVELAVYFSVAVITISI